VVLGVTPDTPMDCHERFLTAHEELVSQGWSPDSHLLTNPEDSRRRFQKESILKLFY